MHSFLHLILHSKLIFVHLQTFKKIRYDDDNGCVFIYVALSDSHTSSLFLFLMKPIMHFLSFQVQKQEANLQRFLYQDLYYTQSELLPIKRAAIVFLGK